ncbi:hypothetical protein FRB99_004941 [Tulasnella sp. 403]|nr:hypothetical protein FRB99_004941 [Tulasnella sp. 403]
MSSPPAGFPLQPGLVPPPPLPPGWAEHVAPGGQPYYYHAQTNTSTYVRPIPGFTGAPPGITSQPSNQDNVVPPQVTKTKKKKEKPLDKTPIPGTPWLRVKTNEGNIFYTHTEKKESVWEVPEEIAEAVAALGAEGKAQKTADVMDAMIKHDGPANVTPSTSTPPKTKADTIAEPVKRKADGVPDGTLSRGKKPKVEDAPPGDVSDPVANTKDDEEAWQRQIAEEMASEEAEIQPSVKDVSNHDANAAMEMQLPKQYNMPQQVNLSSEEARALFKTLLEEQNINPLTPYDSALPHLVMDPRYVLLPSLADRHAAFNEYCLEKSRALRASKQSTNTAATPDPTATTGPFDEKTKARQAYEALLMEDLKSTRTTWDEWRRKWKKDRRFFGFGRDDREREKLFKEWRASLGERKRKQAQKAEADFFALLREHEDLLTEVASDGATPAWKDVKKHKVIYTDPRYDALGSSSLREELFGTYLKARLNPNSAQPHHEHLNTPGPSNSKLENEGEEEGRKRARQERAERATRERQAEVEQQRAKVDRDISRSLVNLSGSNANEYFMTLLTDAIREPTATYRESIPLLSKSPVFTNSPLPVSQRQALFAAHVKKLRDNQLSALYAIFEGYTPGLDARFQDVPTSIYATTPAVKLGLGKRPRNNEDGTNDSYDRRRDLDERRTESEMRRLWEDWQDIRNKRAREDFDRLLEENQFVGFWAGVGKMSKDGKAGDGTIVPGVGATDADEEDNEGEGGGGKADLKALARGIGEKQIEGVLKHDKRYRVFDHVPEQRERWIKDFVARMTAPKLSVHVPTK